MQTLGRTCVTSKAGRDFRPRWNKLRGPLGWTSLLFFSIALLAADQKTVVLVGGGSTVPLPLYKKWKEQYNKRKPTVQMDYVPFGTSEGIAQIENGKSDFGAGEVVLSRDDRAKGDLMELPVAIIGIVPVYNLPSVHQELRFSGELLAEIFLGEVKTWNDPRIAKLNSGVSLPEMPIRIVYRPGGKGTNYVFTDFLSKVSPKFREKVGRTPSPHWPVGTAAERSSDMGEKVKNSPGAIGYIETQYLADYHLGVGAVLNPAGRYVRASSETMLAAVHSVMDADWTHFAVSLTNAQGADSFPITSFTWIYLRKPRDPQRAAALSDLLSWMFTEGQASSLQEGYPRLPDPLLVQIKTKAGSLR